MLLSLTQGLHQSLQCHPAQTATVCADRRQNFAQLADRVARFGSALQALGVKADDRIAILALNSDRFIESYLGTFWAGAVISPHNIRWTRVEISYALQNSGASLLIADDHFSAMAQALKAEGLVHTVIHIGDAPTPDGMLGYETLLAQSLPMADVRRSGDDLAMLLYTGGTTGQPKGVMLSHANMASASLGVTALGCGTNQVHLHAVPLFHMAGIQMMFNHFVGGGTHVVLPAFTPLATLQIIAAEHVESLMLVPTMLQMMIEHPEAKALDLSRLQRVFYGAAPIAEALLHRAMSLLPQAEFIQGYGMTETGITLMLPARYHTTKGQKLGKLRAAGIATPEADVRIVDSEDQEMTRGAAGEIIVRGPMVMRGYWQQAELTAETLRGGWMHTGDVGVMDEDGFVFIVDRLKDMIVSGGENVYSSEVENTLAQHPDVSMCAVIGIPHEKWGEAVHAVVVRKADAPVTEEALITHCRQLIAVYKCPRSIEFRHTLPMSAAGKLLKNELRAEYWKGHTRGVA